MPRDRGHLGGGLGPRGGGFGPPPRGFGGPPRDYRYMNYGAVANGGARGLEGSSVYEGTQNLFIFPELRSTVKYAVKKHGYLKGTVFGFVNYVKRPFLTMGDNMLLVKAEYCKNAGKIKPEEFAEVEKIVERRRIRRSFNYGYISEKVMEEQLKKVDNKNVEEENPNITSGMSR